MCISTTGFHCVQLEILMGCGNKLITPKLKRRSGTGWQLDFKGVQVEGLIRKTLWTTTLGKTGVFFNEL